MSPTISVIVPVYNSEDFLFDCLFSIQNQSFSDFEVILVDDGSSDSSAYICKEFSQKDSRFRFFSNPNMGVSKTRNFALDRAKGTYIAFVDSDDWIHPDFLKVLYNAAKVNGSDIVFCSLYFWYPESHTLQKKGNVENNTFTAQEFYSVIFSLKDGEKRGATDGYIANKFFNFSRIKDIRFDENSSAGEDEKFIYNCIEHSQKISYVNQPLYYYRQRGASLVRSSKFLLNFLSTRQSLLSQYTHLSKDQKTILIAAYAQSVISGGISLISDNRRNNQLLAELKKHAERVLELLKENPETINLLNHYYYPRRWILKLFYLPEPCLEFVLKLASKVYSLLRK